MEPLISKSTVLILLLLATALTITAAELTDRELNAAVAALRYHWYSLFPNAIATSDLILRLLDSSFPANSSAAFTLFAPPDPLLFSLDLSSTASHYLHSLLRHASPAFLPLSVLRGLRSGSYIDTLASRHRLLVGRSLVFANGTFLESLSLDGVRILVPDLFLGSGIAVHGLEGILVSGPGSDYDDPSVDLGGGGDPPSVLPVVYPPAAGSPSMDFPVPVGSPAAVPKPAEENTKDSRSKKHHRSHRHRRGHRRGSHSHHSNNGGGDDGEVGHSNFEKYNHRYGQ